MTRGSGKAVDDWLTLPAALIAETGLLCLRESARSDLSALLKRLRSGDYTKPFVVDDGCARRLHFGLDFVQSEMQIAAPEALVFSYTRMMMACLLFAPRPRHVMIVGLGGGSLTKFCYRQLPQARVTTIEIDGDVIAFGPLFELPPSDARLRLVHADAVDWLGRSDECADILLIDGCDKHGISGAFRNERFYRDLKARLSPRGVLVMNLIGPAAARRPHVQQLAQVFEGRAILHTIRRGKNRLLFAFRDPCFAPDWPALERRALRLQATHGLDFPAFCRRLRASPGCESFV